jgi:hypothetical protein
MAKVRVVLSWSRPRSREVARILREWLQNVIQGIDPWMSEEDIPKGSQWLLQLQRALADSRFGIVCLTPENVTAEWLHFEAGAIWKALDEGRVCPFLVGIPGGASNINPPLGLFQACDASSDDDIFRMMKAINVALPDGDRLSDGALDRSFRRWLPDLRERLLTLTAAQTAADEPSMSRRAPEEMLAEILDTVRDLDRRSTPAWAADLLWPEPGTGVVDLDLDTSPDSPDVVLGASPLAREVAQVLAQQKARAAALRNRAKKKE